MGTTEDHVIAELEYSDPDGWIDERTAAVPDHLPTSERTDHPTRSRLLHLIRRHPGLTIQDLADLTNVERTTVQYHTRKLEQERLISCRCQGRNRLHFPAGMDRSLRRAMTLMYVDSIRLLVERLLQDPEMVSPKALADRLQVSTRTVRRGLNRLKDADLIEVESRDDGKIAKLHPCTGAAVHWWNETKTNLR